MSLNLPNKPVFGASGEGAGAVKAWCERYGYAFSESGDAGIAIATITSADERFAYIPETHALSDEIYLLETEGALPRATAAITYAGERGLTCALNEIARRIKRGRWRTGSTFDYPRFPIRGIIEGFYGQPWSQEQRLDMLRFIAERNMNAYFYGPKDDAFHRYRWRDLYDDASYRRLQDVFAETSALGLDFYYCLAPGLSMRYSSEDDYRTLLRKFGQLRGLGVRKFGLLYDDIPEKLQHPEDIAAYPDLVAAHVRLANRLHGDLLALDPGIRLVVCPTQYWGKGNEYYISKLGAGLHPTIDLFWTGRNICSQELTLAEAATFAQSTFRPPLYWDNYPVNDLEMSDEIHIGPYRQRDPHLYRFSRGVVANGMEFPESSKIAFATIASYSWNPPAYEPEAAWREAIEDVAGSKGLAHTLRFADNVRYSCLYQTDSPTLADEIGKLEFDWLYGNRAEAIRRFRLFAADMRLAADALEAGDACNPKLRAELARWIGKYAEGCKLLGECADYLVAPDEAKRERIARDYEHYKADRTYVFADVLAGFLNKVVDGSYA